MYSINTRCSPNLHLRRETLTIQQKGVYYSGIKIFSSLPLDTKTCFENSKTFRKDVKEFLCTNFCYSLDEYYKNNNNKFLTLQISLIHIIHVTFVYVLILWMICYIVIMWNPVFSVHYLYFLYLYCTIHYIIMLLLHILDLRFIFIAIFNQV